MALRIDMDNIEENVQEQYKNFEVDDNLHTFFYKINSTLQELLGGKLFHDKHQPMDVEDALFFFSARQDIFANLSLRQREYLQSLYPFLVNVLKEPLQAMDDHP